MAQLKRKLLTASPAILGAGMLACGACCIPLLATLTGAVGIGVVARATDEAISIAAGMLLIATSLLLLWHERRKLPSCASTEWSAAEPALQGAPVACTLTPGEFKARSAWLADLASRMLISSEIHDSQAVLKYQLEAKVDVQKMVEQERDCCRFLEYELSETPSELTLNIRARQCDIGDLKLLLSHLIPNEREMAARCAEKPTCGCS